MSRIKELHARAMEHAEQALMARMRGETGLAVELFREALKCEAAAIDELDEYSEPTFSILHRSAGTLALDCNDLRTAERMAARALAKEPPPDVAQELRDLLEQIHFRRHLELRGIALGEDEVQMNLTGPAVGFGLVNSDEFLTRVNDSSRLLHRIVERRRKTPFRERGRAARDIEENYELFISTPRAASFSVTLKLGSPVGQQTFPELLDASAIVDEFMDLMDLANESKISEIRERIPEPAYFRNFLGLARKIAPDGDRIRQVGFTVIRGESQRCVGITRRSAEFVSLTPESPAVEPKTVTVRGMLRYADATRSGSNEIKVIDDEKQSHLVKVPEGMMNDIVRPMWDSVVEITGTRESRYLMLEDIREVRTVERPFDDDGPGADGTGSDRRSTP